MDRACLDVGYVVSKPFSLDRFAIVIVILYGLGLTDTGGSLYLNKGIVMVTKPTIPCHELKHAGITSDPLMLDSNFVPRLRPWERGWLVSGEKRGFISQKSAL